MESAESRDALRIALAARTFSLAAIGAGVLQTHPDVVRTTIALVTIAFLGQVLSAARHSWMRSVTIAEGVAVAMAATLVPGGSDLAFPYLAVPILIGGVIANMRGVWTVLVAEFGTVACLLVITDSITLGTFTRASVWAITGFGLGLLGASINRLVTERPDDRPYRDAVALIEQLHALSGRLNEGLDVAGTAARLLQRAGVVLGLESAVVFTRSPHGSTTPLAVLPGTDLGALSEVTEHLSEAWLSETTWRLGRSVAVPLLRDGRVIAVLAGRLHADEPAEAVSTLGEELAGEILRLDAALMFAEVSASATHEERQRLAREVHDGLAQDLASLGYLLDAVDVRADDADARLSGIRAEITRVLHEVRHSVFDLRNDAVRKRSLGDSVAALAQHVRTHSPIQVHLSLDESSARLRTDVESQLLRITQEAMSNARKHSGAANLWVRCRVDAPVAEIEVRDDGAGLGAPREDSHGLAIMRERAERIGALLDVHGTPAPGHGTRVLVRLGGKS